MMPLSRRLPTLFLAASVFASAQAGGSRTLLTQEQVAAAVTSMAGIAINPAEIALPANLASASTDPVLRITQTEIAPSEGVRLRVVCEAVADCLPFVVLLRTHTPEQAADLAAQIDLKLARNLPIRSKAGLRLRAGVHATFLLESEHMRISIPVITIDAGTPGAEVRVASLDRKQVYRGVVRDSETVRGTMP